MGGEPFRPARASARFTAPHAADWMPKWRRNGSSRRRASASAPTSTLARPQAATRARWASNGVTATPPSA